MDKLQIITQGLDENFAYYINDSLFRDLSPSDGVKSSEELLTDIMLKYNVETVEWYTLTDEGNEAFYNAEYNFLDNFDDYQPNMIKFKTKKNRN